MSLQTSFAATLSLNTAGGVNSPSPTDIFSSLVSVGSYFLPPSIINVPATGSTVTPFSSLAASNTSSHIMIANTGGTSAPNIVVDLKNVTGNSSQLQIAPGGRLYFFSAAITPGATGTNSNPAAWTLSSATAVATTASVSITYA